MLRVRRRQPLILLIPRPLFIALTVVLVLALGGSLTFVTVLTPGLKNKVIVIDPGHGGRDPGAQYGGLQEKSLNLDIALRLKKTLSTKGCKVILTRETDKDFFTPGFVQGRMAKRAELNQRIGLATANNADLFISLHANSFPQRSSYGMETYYHLKSAPGKALAERIQNRLLTVQKDNKRQAKAGDYYLINQTKMPAVIVEVGFISNPRERAMLSKDAYKDSIATAIAEGIEEYFADFPFGVQETTPTLASAEGPDPAGTQSFKLYYPNETLDSLTSEERTAAPGWPVLTVIQKAQYIVQELIKGPVSRQAVSLISPETKVLDISLQNGIVTIDFSHKLRDEYTGGAAEEDLTVNSIVWSIAQLPRVKGVRILIDGQFGESIGGHVLLNHTFSPQPKAGEVAIVIDDFGINNPGTQQMLELGVPITAAVMPNMTFSRQEAEQIHARGYEIFLHMPVEAKDARPEWQGPGALLTGLSDQELSNRLNQALASVPYAVGISNHMGSKGTEDSRIVGSLINMARERGLFILDSKTTERTLLLREALKAGIPAGTRDVFLDNAADLGTIKNQLRQLIALAKKNGKAIGIGHVGPQGPLTARAIREILPEMEAQGVQLVPLSEILLS